jgi:adenylate cyclase
MKMPIPIRGPLSLPFRALGITQSKMNPNICTICERSFAYVKKQRRISAEATILFADIRGYTSLSARLDSALLAKIVEVFHDQCGQAIWAQDGIVNKQMGDGLMAIFNFPIKSERHASAAVAAGIDMQRRFHAALADLSPRVSESEAIGFGVGIHSGQVEIGEFSTYRSDFTAIGGAVNLTARLESQAAAGEILVSPEAASEARELMADAAVRTFALKGIDRPVRAFVLTASP